MATQAITSIAQVDDHVRRSQVPLDGISSFERRFTERSSIHGQLLILKKLSREHPVVDRVYERRRIRQSEGRAAPSQTYIDGYAVVLGEISQAQGNVFGNNRVRHFLDLGFSPGGFSTWLLQSNSQCTGVGITLHDSQSGYGYVPTDTLSTNRFSSHFHDIVVLTMQALRNGINPIASLPASNDNDTGRSFDFIIAGAFPTLEGKTPWYRRIQLVLSQLYIVLTNLREHGSALFLINTKPFRWQVEMIGILRACFGSVVSMKGSQHKTRTSCYIVCTGFQASQDRISTYARKLGAALERLENIAARVGSGQTQPGDPEVEFTSILGHSDQDIFNAEYQHILRLFQPQWAEQFNAIRDQFKSILEGEASSASSSDWRDPRTQGSWSPSTRRSSSTFGFNTTGASSSQNWRRGR